MNPSQILGDIDPVNQLPTINESLRDIGKSTEQSRDQDQNTHDTILDLTESNNNNNQTLRDERRVAKTTQSTTQQKSNQLGKRKEPSSTTTTDPNYVSLLTSTPVDSSKEPNTTNTNRGDMNQPPLSGNTNNVDLENPKEVWDHALSLASQAEVEEATVYFQIHAR